MNRFSIVLFLNIFYCSAATAQVTDSINITASIMQDNSKQDVYKIKPWLDIPLTIAVDAWSLYGMSVIYGRDPIPEAEVMMLNKNSINRFDRPVADNYSIKSKELSDKFFYGSMPLPLFLLLDKKIRKDGLKVGLLFLETMGTTGVLYTSSAMIADRYRPYAYNPEVSMGTRTRGGARNSFFAGHPAVVASSTFFMAKVYADYHPGMRNKWILYTLAGSATAATGILRIKAGQHFYSDVITGVTVGTLVGILVPHLHKNKAAGQGRLSLLPDFRNGAGGFTALYKLGN